jgi:uncharacterized membrane protein YeaQ/YmgE (transglycosylase-associated protein family)
MGFFGFLLLGLIAGAIAKLILPGKQGGGWIATLILGVVGAMLGGWLGSLLFDASLEEFFSGSEEEQLGPAGDGPGCALPEEAHPGPSTRFTASMPGGGTRAATGRHDREGIFVRRRRSPRPLRETAGTER